MLRSALGTGLALALLAAPAASQAEATLKLLKSPVPAGEVVKLRLHLDQPPRGALRGAAGAGGVGPFTQTAAGTWEAEYSPPKGIGPALVAIAVYEDRPGGEVAYALANIAETVKTKAKVKGREPVYVRAGAERYGPFHADAHGELDLSFPANGELTSAELESPQGKPLGKVALKPTLARTVAFARPSQLRASDAGKAEILLLVAYERALKFDAPRAVASAGTATLDVKGSPDYALRYLLGLPGQSASGAINVKFIDSVGKQVGSADFLPPTAPVAKVTLRLPTKALGAGSKTVLEVNLLDKDGHGTEGELALTVDSGKLDAPLPLGDGLYNVSFTAPTQMPPGGTIHLKAAVVGSPASASGEMVLRGGKPAKVIFAKPREAPAAGEAVSLEVQVVDEGGSPAEPDDLAIAVEHGEVTGLKRKEAGRYVVDVQSDDGAPDMTLTAKDGRVRLEGEQTFTFEPEVEMPFLVLGPEAGFGNNFGHVSAANVTVAGQLLVGPRSAAPLSATVGFLIGYLPEVTSTLTSDQSTAGTLQLSRIPVMVRGGGFYALDDLGLFGGLGLGVEKLSGSLNSVGRPTLPLDAWRPAAGLYAGAGYKLGPGYISLELRATYASVDLQNEQVRVHGPVGGVDGALGYLFAL
jgi:hypothetical protein